MSDKSHYSDAEEQFSDLEEKIVPGDWDDNISDDQINFKFGVDEEFELDLGKSLVENRLQTTYISQSEDSNSEISESENTLTGSKVEEDESESDHSLQGACALPKFEHSEQIKTTKSAPSSPEPFRKEFNFKKLLESFQNKCNSAPNSPKKVKLNINSRPVHMNTRSSTPIENKPFITPKLDEVDSSLRTYKGKQIKMATEAAQEKTRHDHLKKLFDSFEVRLNTLVGTVETDCKKQDKDADHIEVLEKHIATLSSYKTMLGRKTLKLMDTIDQQKGTTQYENYENLEIKHTEADAKIVQWMEKVKRVIKEYHKNEDISNREKLSMPKYEGDYLVFNTYSTQFMNFTKGMGEEDKKMHLAQSLVGAPYKKISHLIDGNASFKTCWDTLKSHYADERRVADATISGFFSIKKPGRSVQEIQEHFAEMRNKAALVNQLGLTLEQLLAHYYLLRIPGKLRGQIENAIDGSKYTFDAILPHLEGVCRRQEYDDSDDESSLTAAAAQIKNKPVSSKPDRGGGENLTNNNEGNPNRNRGRGFGFRGQRGYRSRGRGRGYTGQHQAQQQSQQFSCYICSKLGHLARFCQAYRRGPEMRARLKELGRCDACLIKKTEHPTDCHNKDLPCVHCGELGHADITCDSKKHPGSWVQIERANS